MCIALNLCKGQILYILKYAFREAILVFDFFSIHLLVTSKYSEQCDELMNCWNLAFNVLYFSIERFWRELWSGVSLQYYNKFLQMESDGFLDVEDDLDLLAFHLVMLVMTFW